MQFEESPNTGNGSNIFVSLKDGESIKGIPQGKNKVFYKKWADGKSVECDKSEDGAKFRFKLNLVINENGEYRAKVFEQGPSVYNALKELSEDYNLEETVIKITRKGTGLDTRYTVMPMPTKLDDKQMKLIEAAELHSLEPQQKNGLKNHAPSAPSFDSEEEVPF